MSGRLMRLNLMMDGSKVVIIIPPDDPIIDPNTLALVLPVPPGTQAGDMLFALISTDGNPTMVLPAGWDNEDSIGGTAKSFVDYNLSDGADPATYTWTLDGVEDAIGAIFRFRHVDPDTPINAKVKPSLFELSEKSPAAV